MINRQTGADEGAGEPECSELYGSLVLEIDAAFAEGAPTVLESASLAGLSHDEIVQLREARQCLELLYRSSGKFRRREKAAASTVSLDVDVPLPCRNSGRQAGDERIERSRLGRFEVVRELGRGGQGVVFLARDPTLNRLVALKVPRPEILMTAAMRRRFLREGQAAAILTHPNVVTVLEAGQIGPICYLAQVYVAGPTLADWQQRHSGPISVRTVASIAARLADGVEYAHARGVLHRDLKPSNVLLDSEHSANVESERSPDPSDGSELPFVPRIADFGIARMLETEGNETVTGTILGTAAYMPPEQAAGHSRQMDAASDVYSLGAILYELLTNSPVFRGETILETLRLVTTVEPTAPRKLRADIPRDLEAICLKCLEKDPRRRYASAFELAADLRRFLAHEPTRVRPINPAEHVIRWCRRKPTIAGLIGFSAAALLALIANIVWSRSRLEQLVVEANEGRRRAEINAKLANDNKELAMRREIAAETMAYAADLRLVSESWESSSGPALNALLRSHVPTDRSRDLRGFEWWLYDKRLNYDNPSKELGTHRGGVKSVAVSPKGDLAASGGADGIIRLWDLASGAPAGELHGHARRDINGLAFDPDGSRLASASDDNTVRVWDVRGRMQLRCLIGHTGWVSAVVFLSDGETVASGAADKTIIVWDLTSGKAKRRLSGHGDTVRTLAFQRPGGILFSASEDGTVRAWDVKSGSPSQLFPNGTLENPGGYWIRSLAIEPDQTTLLGIPFADQPLIVWDLRPEHTREIRELKVAGNARSASIQGTAKNPVVAFGLEDSYVRIRRYGSEEDARVLGGHLQTVDAVALTPDAKALISGSRDGSVRLWDLESAGRVTRKSTFKRPIFALVISPNGTRVAASTTDGETTLLDFKTLKTLRRIPAIGGLPRALAFSPDSATLAAISPREPLRLYSSAGQPTDIDVPGTSGIDRISFSPDGRLLAIADRRAAIIVDIERAAVLKRLAHESPIRDAVFIDNANLLTSCVGGDLGRWSLHAEQTGTSVPLHAGELVEIALSPDLRYGAVHGYRQVKIFDPTTLQVLASVPDRDQAGGICFLAGGRTLLLGNGVTHPGLWQTGTWKRIGMLETESIFGAKASADGYRLVGSHDRLLTAIDASPTEESRNPRKQ